MNALILRVTSSSLKIGLIPRVWSWLESRGKEHYYVQRMGKLDLFVMDLGLDGWVRYNINFSLLI
jgi:hypothetical protein